MLGIPRHLLLPLALGTLLVACEGSDTQFATRLDPELGGQRHAVSVLGAYRDGRPSSDAWDLVERNLTAAFRSTRCDLGYNTLVAANDARADAVDEHARGDRSTEDLLAKLAPGAEGDLILIVQVDGNLPDRERVAQKIQGGGARSSAPQSLGGHTSGRLGGMPGRGSLATTTSFEGAGDSALFDRSVLGINASFFSVKDGRLVASVSMDYSGSHPDEASERFAAKLVRSLPEMTCVGWKWEPPAEPSAVPREAAPASPAPDAGPEPTAAPPSAPPSAPKNDEPPTGVPGLTNGL